MKNNSYSINFVERNGLLVLPTSKIRIADPAPLTRVLVLNSAQYVGYICLWKHLAGASYTEWEGKARYQYRYCLGCWGSAPNYPLHGFGKVSQYISTSGGAEGMGRHEAVLTGYQGWDCTAVSRSGMISR